MRLWSGAFRIGASALLIPCGETHVVSSQLAALAIRQGVKDYHLGMNPTLPPHGSKAHIEQVAHQQAKDSAAKNLRDQAESVNILALELELNYARAQHQKHLGEVKDNPYAAAMFRTRKEREDAHRLFEEAEEIAFQELERSIDLTGEPDFEGGERESAHWTKFTEGVREYQVSMRQASEPEQAGVLGEMLNAARAGIARELERASKKLQGRVTESSEDDGGITDADISF